MVDLPKMHSFPGTENIAANAQKMDSKTDFLNKSALLSGGSPSDTEITNGARGPKSVASEKESEDTDSQSIDCQSPSCNTTTPGKGCDDLDGASTPSMTATDTMSQSQDLAPDQSSKEGASAGERVSIQGGIVRQLDESYTLEGSWLFHGTAMGSFTYTCSRKEVQEGAMDESSDSATFTPGDVFHWYGFFNMLNPAYDLKKKKKRSTRKHLVITERFEIALAAPEEPCKPEGSDTALELETQPTVEEPAKVLLSVSGFGRNRFGRFKVSGTLDSSGALDCTKEYCSKTNAGLSDDESGSQSRNSLSGKGRKFSLGDKDPNSGTRSSKRQRIPNRLLMLDTGATNYAFIARHGNGSALTASELAVATGVPKKEESLSFRKTPGSRKQRSDLHFTPSMCSPDDFMAEEGVSQRSPGTRVSFDTKLLSPPNMRDVQRVFLKPLDSDKASIIRKTARRKTIALVRQLIRDQACLKSKKPPATPLARSVSIASSCSNTSAIKDEEPEKVKDEKGQLYQGGIYDGMRHGLGICVFEDGKVYEGEWQYGQAHGKGVLLNAKGQLMYQGEFSEGAISGRGSHFWENGDRFDGEFKDAMLHGFGRFVDALSGATYQGEWSRGKRHGYGTFTLKDGSFYTGEWIDDIFNGRGSLSIKDVISFQGNFKNGNFEGRGVCAYANQGSFEGAFRNGLKEGRGTYCFENGAVYEGRFRQDCLEGFGTLKMENERTVRIGEDDWIIPVSVKSEMKYVHRAAGFGEDGN